jgi:glucose/arabinose dehydrogenase
MRVAPLLTALSAALLAACSGTANNGTPAPAQASAPPEDATATPPANAQPFASTEFGKFNEPWAMTFLPDGRLLVTQKSGELKLFDPASKSSGDITGVPKVDHGGQGGLGDVVLHPQFASNGLVYFSYAEAGPGDTRGGVVARGKLTLDANGGGALSGVETIWTQVPKVSGRGHYAHRIAFSPDGAHVFITSGEREKFDPAQDMAANLGKVVRLHDDGKVPADNPFAARGGVAAQVWSLGHRNPLGIAFDAQGRLWAQEMGPKHGDELNLIVKGDNYGYPIVSNGDHYDGRPIPDHDTRPDFNAPEVTWVPAISPAGLMLYSGDLFADWKGDAFIGGLSSKGLVRVEFDGETAREAARYDMGARIREVEQGPDGAIWVLEDERDGSQGRLLKLTPQT